MSNQVEIILSYQKIDEELFKTEREFAANEDVQKYAKAVKKVQSVQEKLEGYESKAQVLLNRYNSLVEQLASFSEEKIQLEKTIQETTELVAIDYLKGQISLLASKTDGLKTTLEDLEKEIKDLNTDYLSFAKEIKEAKEFGVSYKDTYKKLKSELDELKKSTQEKLGELEGKIDSEFLSKYKVRRADKKIKFPLVRGCDGKHCSLCGIELDISAKNNISTDMVIECEHCHKFIYLEK